jgi:transposase-like protein
MLICPRCEHGEIRKVRVKAINEQLFVCDECEAAWVRHEAVGLEPWVDFGTYLRANGLKPVWDEVEILPLN